MVFLLLLLLVAVPISAAEGKRTLEDRNSLLSYLLLMTVRPDLFQNRDLLTAAEIRELHFPVADPNVARVVDSGLAQPLPDYIEIYYYLKHHGANVPDSVADFVNLVENKKIRYSVINNIDVYIPEEEFPAFEQAVEEAYESPAFRKIAKEKGQIKSFPPLSRLKILGLHGTPRRLNFDENQDVSNVSSGI